MEENNEQKTDEKGKSEVTTETENAGVQSETTSELDRADQIAERQKRENDRREQLLLREENLEARRRVGGVTEAGQQAQTKTKEQKKTDDAKEFFKDTALGDAISKTNE